MSRILSSPEEIGANKTDNSSAHSVYKPINEETDNSKPHQSISITSDMQMTPPLRQKVKRN